MGRIADRLRELIAEMEELDQRHKVLTEQHIAENRRALEELERLAAE
jgi:prefoldin subunit 5